MTRLLFEEVRLSIIVKKHIFLLNLIFIIFFHYFFVKNTISLINVVLFELIGKEFLWNLLRLKDGPNDDFKTN